MEGILRMIETCLNCTIQPEDNRSSHPRPFWRCLARLAFLVLFAVVVFLGGAWPPAHADLRSRRADLFVQRQMTLRRSGGWSSVIITMNGHLTAVEKAQLKKLRVDIYRHLPLIHAVAARVPSRNLTSLADLPFVGHLSADARIHKSDEFTVASSYADIAYQRYSLTGNGVTVAVVDSGVRPHKDLADPSNQATRIVDSVNFVTGNPTVDDLCGHGTHVAGIIAGNGAASTGNQYFRTFYGIARKANIVNVRVLDANGQSDVSTVVAGIQWVINNRARYNIRILNLSLGHPVG